jgi:excisionase family DNA binding protein
MTYASLGGGPSPSDAESHSGVLGALRDDAATRLLTADDLAARWRVPRAHVYRLTREYGLPVVRLGRYYRYRLAAIEAWEAAQEAAQEAMSNHE